MVPANTRVATRINKIESHAHLTHYHGHALETIKAIKIMRGALDAALSWIHFKYSLKSQEASNRLKEDTAPGNSVDRALCSNRWTVRGTLLQSILDNWAVFQELWDDILEGKVDSEIRGQVIRVQTQKQSFNFFFWIQLGVVLMHTDNLSSSLQKVSQLQKYVFQYYKVWERKLVFICFWKRWPQTTKKKESFELQRGRKSSCKICI